MLMTTWTVEPIARGTTDVCAAGDLFGAGSAR